jgi:hypothetical protein
MDMLSHDLTNHQQAALGFLELLERSEHLGDSERRLISRTVESLGHSARLLLQVRALLAKAEQATVKPSAVKLDLVAESARRAVEGVFFTHRISFETDGLSAVPRIRADSLLTEGAPADRDCLLRMQATSSGERVLLSLTSEGFALDPRVTDGLTQERAKVGRSRASESLSLVRELLDHYGATSRLEPVPNAVGAQLVIDMPAWEGS